MTTAAQVREKVDHPIIDADGHFVEIGPVLEEELVTYLEEAGGHQMRDRYLASWAKPFDTSTALADRGSPSVKEQWRSMPSWWGWQTKNTYDRATAHLPKLMYERMDEMGIDFMLCYPSAVLGLLDIEDGEVAGAVAHAANRWLVSIFEPYKHRMAVGGIIPMNTPQVASAAVEHAASIGMKTTIMASMSAAIWARSRRAARRRTASTHTASTANMITIRCGPSSSTPASRRWSTVRISASG